MCYTIPLVSALTTSIIWHKEKNIKIWWLNLMFYGGAIFGIIDHLWNGELFLFSKNIVSDLLLGIVITLLIIIGWLAILNLIKINPKPTYYQRSDTHE